jgi:hypothetical protein
MENFLSAVYIKTNNISDEKLCVGLLLVSNDKVHFRFSEDKIKVLSNLTSKEIAKSIDEDLKRIELDTKNIKPSIFPSHKNYYNSEYFNYLSQYSSGLLIFTAPEPLAAEFSPDLYNNLFNKFVGEPTVKHAKNKPSNFKRQIQKILSREIFLSNTDTNFELTPELVPNLLMPTKVDFIACNGSILAGKSIDFNAELPTIQTHINSFWVATESLKSLVKNTNNMEDDSGIFNLYIDEAIDKEHKRLVDTLVKNPIKPFVVKNVEELEVVERTLSHYEKFSVRMSNNK